MAITISINTQDGVLTAREVELIRAVVGLRYDLEYRSQLVTGESLAPVESAIDLTLAWAETMFPDLGIDVTSP